MNNNDDNNSPVITVTNSLLFKVPPSHLHRQHSDLILKYATLHLLLKLCTILGSLVSVLITFITENIHSTWLLENGKSTFIRYDLSGTIRTLAYAIE